MEINNFWIKIPKLKIFWMWILLKNLKEVVVDIVVAVVVVVLAVLVRLLVRLLVHLLAHQATRALKLAHMALQILVKVKVDMLFTITTTIFLTTKIIFITKGITSKVKVYYLGSQLLTLQLTIFWFQFLFKSVQEIILLQYLLIWV